MPAAEKARVSKVLAIVHLRLSIVCIGSKLLCIHMHTITVRHIDSKLQVYAMWVDGIEGRHVVQAQVPKHRCRPNQALR